MPAKLAPMLAESGDAPFVREGWAWEPKLDGYRVLAFVDAQGVKLRSRRGLELAGDFPRLAAELGKKGVDGMILDGEIVAFDATGRPSFAAMQQRAQLDRARDRRRRPRPPSPSASTCPPPVSTCATPTATGAGSAQCLLPAAVRWCTPRTMASAQRRGAANGFWRRGGSARTAATGGGKSSIKVSPATA